jgi:hypothetical protein
MKIQKYKKKLSFFSQLRQSELSVSEKEIKINHLSEFDQDHHQHCMKAREMCV